MLWLCICHQANTFLLPLTAYRGGQVLVPTLASGPEPRSRQQSRADGAGEGGCARPETADGGTPASDTAQPPEHRGWPWLNLPDLFQVEASL